jgi:hypothetical protein
MHVLCHVKLKNVFIYSDGKHKNYENFNVNTGS